MTRMVAKAYRVADAIRATGVPVVMGGPHVTEMADEALEHCNAVALGEADETWPEIVADAVRGDLKPIYALLTPPAKSESRLSRNTPSSLGTRSISSSSISSPKP